MTCPHVLGLIDAGPFADYPSAHLAAAWEHARHCATCGPALQAAKAISVDLTALPQPAPPPELAASVMARIARIHQPTAADAAAPIRETADGASTRYSWAWAPALGVLSAAFAIVLLFKSGDAARAGLWSARTPSLTAGVLTMPELTSGTLALVACLLVYAVALFAPVGRRLVRGRTDLYR
jgi:hypothetical protein